MMFTFYLSLDIQACSQGIERKERKVERNKKRSIKVKLLLKRVSRKITEEGFKGK